MFGVVSRGHGARALDGAVAVRCMRMGVVCVHHMRGLVFITCVACCTRPPSPAAHVVRALPVLAESGD